MEDNMKDFGKMILEMARDLKDIQIIIHIMEVSETVKLMEKVFILGLMVKFMMVNGTLV
jgi:hypothetical protein